MYADLFGQLAWIDFSNVLQRARIIAILAWVFPMAWALTYLFIELPVVMILFGGAVGSVMLFLIVFAALHMKYTRVSEVRGSGPLYNAAFWVSVVSIVLVGVYGVWQLF
jgi:hypothetical protein